jgi:DNA-directed RNA polymerase specialized sigma24 family protein
VLEDVFAAAHAACLDQEIAAEATRRVLVAHRGVGDPEDLKARGALLAAHRAPHYGRMAPPDRDAVVLARALGWPTDRIARQLGTTPADVRARIGRGLRTLLPPPGCVGAASPARGARGS